MYRKQVVLMGVKCVCVGVWVFDIWKTYLKKLGMAWKTKIDLNLIIYL